MDARSLPFSGPGIPGVTCNSDGNTNFRGTWALKINYYMDLGFLPENMQHFAISGRAGWYGRKGQRIRRLPAPPAVHQTVTEFNSAPIDHNDSTVCNVSPGVSNDSCAEPSLHSAVSLEILDAEPPQGVSDSVR